MKSRPVTVFFFANSKFHKISVTYRTQSQYLFSNDLIYFQSQWVWRVSSDWKRLIIKAVPINQLFPGLPNPIDAAVTVGHNLWVFVGEMIYVIYGNHMVHAPLRLSDIGINEKYVDLAYEWHYFK